MTLGTDIPAFRPSGRSHPRAEARHLVSLSAVSGPSNRFFACAQHDKARVLWSGLSYSCTQRTGKPYARLPLFSGLTLELSKLKYDPLTLDAE